MEPTVGASLRAAREAQGLSIQDVARQLRLMNRQIVAMENEDFASLGQPVFARGFVRNYARLLGLDAQALLHTMGGHVEPVDVIQVPAVVLPGAWFTSGWLIAGLVALLMFTVVPIGLYAWLGSDADEVALAHVPQPQRPTPAVAVPAPAPASPPTEKMPEIPASILNTENGAAGISSVAPPTESIPPAPASAVIQREMRFEFADDAWLEVKDGTGKVLYRHMNGRGSNLSLTGQPPLSLVIGNATQVSMTYGGRPLDLKPYIDANVARFNLEE